MYIGLQFYIIFITIFSSNDTVLRIKMYLTISEIVGLQIFDKTNVQKSPITKT